MSNPNDLLDAYERNLPVEVRIFLQCLVVFGAGMLAGWAVGLVQL